MKPIKEIMHTEIPVPKPFRWFTNSISWTLKWSVKIFLALVVLLIVVESILSVIGGRQYEAELNKLKASGEPYTLVGLAGPTVPANENGAVVYDKIFKTYFKKPTSKAQQKALDALQKVLDPKEKMTAVDWAKAGQVATLYDSLLPMVEQAEAKPECKFPVRWQDGVSALLPHLAPLRDTARTLSAKAVIYARDGKPDEALRCIKLSLRVGDSLKKEPVLISLLVRAAIVTTATRGLQAVLKETDITYAQAKSVYDELAAVDLRQHFVLSMKGERGFGLWFVSHIRDYRASDFFSSIEAENESTPAWVINAVYAAWHPIMYLDAAEYMRSFQKRIDNANLSYIELRRRGMLQEAPFTGFRRVFFLSRILSPVFARARAQVDTRIADLACGQAALMLVAYKDKFGAYPATLDGGSSELGWSIPKDPFTGKSLIYKRKAQGFVFYSIGADLKDNGGRAPKKNYSPQEDGDIVWSRER